MSGEGGFFEPGFGELGEPTPSDSTHRSFELGDFIVLNANGSFGPLHYRADGTLLDVLDVPAGMDSAWDGMGGADGGLYVSYISPGSTDRNVILRWKPNGDLDMGWLATPAGTVAPVNPIWSTSGAFPATRPAGLGLYGAPRLYVGSLGWPPGGGGNWVEIINLPTGTERSALSSLDGIGGAATSRTNLAVSPDGMVLYYITPGGDLVVKRWDLVGGVQMADFPITITEQILKVRTLFDGSVCVVTFNGTGPVNRVSIFDSGGTLLNAMDVQSVVADPTNYMIPNNGGHGSGIEPDPTDTEVVFVLTAYQGAGRAFSAPLYKVNIATATVLDTFTIAAPYPAFDVDAGIFTGLATIYNPPAPIASLAPPWLTVIS